MLSLKKMEKIAQMIIKRSAMLASIMPIIDMILSPLLTTPFFLLLLMLMIPNIIPKIDGIHITYQKQQPKKKLTPPQIKDVREKALVFFGVGC